MQSKLNQPQRFPLFLIKQGLYGKDLCVSLALIRQAPLLSPLSSNSLAQSER